MNSFEQKGLSIAEAARRLREFGFNELQALPTKPRWKLFLEQFKSPLVIILIFACVLSATLGEWVEAAAISAILLVNGAIGFFQEFRAETAIGALRDMTAPRARVKRDGRQTVVAAREVVPGDLLMLEAGDVIAADGRLLRASRLQVNEAVLTGESFPVEKRVGHDRDGQVFMGTSVAAGTAEVEVTETAMKTELGKIAHLMQTAEAAPTPLQLQLKNVGRLLLVLCLLVVSFVAFLGLWQGRPLGEVLVFSLSLAVAAVPEGLPAIVTVALALGVQRMVRRNALIRKLPSVETLGSVTVICTDKTGTLTSGQMRVREIWGEDPREVFRVAIACTDSELTEGVPSGVGDPTEIAILLAGRDEGILREDLERGNPRLEAHPFDSDRKRMSIFREDRRLYAKGAYESLRPLLVAGHERADAAVEDMSSRGLRVLAIAIGSHREESELDLVGLIGIADPPRPEVPDAIQVAKQAGIRLIMITGDHQLTANAIAREIGFSDSSQRDVIARATPEDKLNLVRQLKGEGAIVAMTGDGVNDAPALREAHIGIAMGKAGTEVTRQAADLVLADDNFATIVAAVREGRGIFQNIRKAITYLLVGNMAELQAVIGATVLGLPLPFLAVHLLWINLVTDSLPALALLAEPVSSELMRRRPRRLSESILGRREWTSIFTVGLVEALVILGVYIWSLRSSDIEVARGLALSTLVFCQLIRAFGARSFTQPFWRLGIARNLWLVGVVLATGVAQWSLHEFSLTQKIFEIVPLTIGHLAVVLSASLIPFALIEIQKLVKQMRRVP